VINCEIGVLQNNLFGAIDKARSRKNETDHDLVVMAVAPAHRQRQVARSYTVTTLLSKQNNGIQKSNNILKGGGHFQI
jgi:hypothetical protein